VENQYLPLEFAKRSSKTYFWFQNGTILPAMATITLKNIPDALYQRLKMLAKQRHRSLNSEIIHNLEKSLGVAAEDPHLLREQIEEYRNRITKRGQLTPEEIEKSINEGRP
jgi:plasmid stability protein